VLHLGDLLGHPVRDVGDGGGEQQLGQQHHVLQQAGQFHLPVVSSRTKVTVWSEPGTNKQSPWKKSQHDVFIESHQMSIIKPCVGRQSLTKDRNIRRISFSVIIDDMSSFLLRSFNIL
jgi:hypothetical protein